MALPRSLTLAIVGAAACLAGAVAQAGPLDAEANTDGFNPAAESNDFNEVRRQNQIARQIELNYRLYGSAGYGPQYSYPFEPWPRVPGDIWGYPQNQKTPQPIGHESVKTGPNRWLYRPLYAPAPPVNTGAQPANGPPPAAPRAPRSARPANARPPAPSDASPEDFVAPVVPGNRAPADGAPKTRGMPAGAREF